MFSEDHPSPKSVVPDSGLEEHRTPSARQLSFFHFICLAEASGYPVNLGRSGVYLMCV